MRLLSLLLWLLCLIMSLGGEVASPMFANCDTVLVAMASMNYLFRLLTVSERCPPMH